jgi:hypothetical protein
MCSSTLDTKGGEVLKPNRDFAYLALICQMIVFTEVTHPSFLGFNFNPFILSIVSICFVILSIVIGYKDLVLKE